MNAIRLSLALAALATALSAHAGILSYDLPPGDLLNGTSETQVVIPAFDTRLGALTSVSIVAAASGSRTGRYGYATVNLYYPTPVTFEYNGTSSPFGHGYDLTNGQFTGEPTWTDLGTVQLPLEWGQNGFGAWWYFHDYSTTGGYQVQLRFNDAVVPEPSALAALAFPALALLRRRRQA